MSQGMVNCSPDLTGLRRPLSSLAEDHLIAQEFAAALFDGRGQLDEFDAFVDGEL